jgi:hypothetical protein
MTEDSRDFSWEEDKGDAIVFRNSISPYLFLLSVSYLTNPLLAKRVTLLGLVFTPFRTITVKSHALKCVISPFLM